MITPAGGANGVLVGPRRREVVAAVIYQEDPNGNDRVALEERMTPVSPDAEETIGFPGGKIEATDASALHAIRRELHEELSFTSPAGEAVDVRVEQVGTLLLSQYNFTLFVARLTPDTRVSFTRDYQPKVTALHWRRPVAVNTDSCVKMMASTRPLLALVPFPPVCRQALRRRSRAPELPSSGARVPTENKRRKTSQRRPIKPTGSARRSIAQQLDEAADGGTHDVA